MLQLNNKNYYSHEANEQYLSVSQYKNFIDCEARALAELRGEYEPEDKEAFLVGNFVHAWADNKLDDFIFDHPEIISSRGATKGELKKDFQQAQEMINVLADDPMIMQALEGRSEVPLVGEIDGVPWKGKADKINDDLDYILDLKTTKSISKFEWSNKLKKYVSFIEMYDYFVQVAVYSELERQVSGNNNWKDFFIVAVSKEKHPDHELINVTDHERVAAELEAIKENQKRIVAIKKGEVAPERCNSCEYCRQTKKIKKPIYYGEMVEK